MRKAVSVLTTALSLVVGLVICEIIIRKVDGVPLWPLRHPSLAVAEYHPLLGWRHREYLGPGHRFITGAFGMRMNSVGVRPPEPGGILVVGDSFALGSEVREHETFPAQLERLLVRHVMNAAVHGYGSEQMILNAEDLIPILQPSFLVIGMMDVAINRAGYEMTYGDHRPWFDVSSGELRHHNNPVPRRLRSRLGWLGHSYLAVWITDHIESSGAARHVSVENDPAVVTCALLRRLKVFTDAQSIPVIMAMLYAGTDRLAQTDKATEKVRPTTVAKCGAELGIEIVDLWEPMVAMARDDPDAYRGLYNHRGAHQEIWGHLSVAGNAFVARQIAQRMRTMIPVSSAQGGLPGN
jgi:hypothetical protein